MQRWLNSASDKTDTEAGDSKNRRMHTWTDIHSFYALMGGFALSTHDLPPEKKFLPGSRDVVILLRDGLEYVAEHEPSIIPDLSKEEILDKSKASGFDKTIVCIQATWFLTQLIARIGQGLPISLLELSTAAHSICALLIYILWWDKPTGVGRPTLISGERMHGLCAAFCFNTWFDGRRDCGLLELLPADGRWKAPPTTVLPCAQVVDTIPPGAGLEPDKVYGLYDRQCVAGLQCCFADYEYDKRPFQHRLYMECSSRDIQRWRFTSDWLRPSRVEFDRLDRVNDRSPDWPSALTSAGLDAIIDFDKTAIPVFIGFSAAGMLYGGLHLLAWTAPFYSSTHAVLWKVAAVNIACSGIYGVALSASRVLGELRHHLQVRINRATPTRLSLALQTLVLYGVSGTAVTLSILFILAIPFYLFSRAFLMVECFISLAYLPPEVFQQAEWSSYFPHIS
jgi:hypothetical protein